VRDGWAIVVPYVTDEEIAGFLREWKTDESVSWLVLEQDVDRRGCGATKNKGISRALDAGAEWIVVLDSDCYPTWKTKGLQSLVNQHAVKLEAQQVKLFQVVTDPPSRGTPYAERYARMPVAASMGFWEDSGDYCAVRRLALGPQPMVGSSSEAIYQRWFPLCGMNLAFRPRDWMPWCQFIEVPRFDDIWMGWLWQREAYRRGYCFHLGGPIVRHRRQSDVWNNLRQEAVHLEASETLWKEIATNEATDYETLRKLLPC